ncbi:D-alanyl-lipoteichoic acid acyltransferase DltB, MBOAT superfamily [Mesonia phycicola]|uniref:D-alanyl-lipoteichoic acid acyltransferase DltB, MBOAT superfamily n=1 Tax=Mesonia phycicola TaxID=579105 RepID=A0A1M6AM73_9FLAO|nr:MBOAT family O-acyltransferase [Mesonia phycicola]SHI37517.1 D-alanyl-lipoteichoic acid acyltransferase DltB, MBOAT superfamily [Mesonia phycicola]
MLFNSFTFLVFLPIVFVLYWGLQKKSFQLQNIVLLIASYIFYGWWDYRFLALIFASTLVDYLVGLNLAKQDNIMQRKILLSISLLFNLGLLCYFKYTNFFIDSWIEAWDTVGIHFNISSLSIILPVGISFYTFQTLSYTIDIYRKQLKPTTSFLRFATYVAFFPQLVAGPIERAAHLLPQFDEKRIFDFEYAKSGVSLILWGMFKKVVIADNCAFFVNQIYDNVEAYSSVELSIGAILFGLQIYGDFSGYSDIAIGVARLFGFDLMTNFRFPYFSKSIPEFWRRWHISLSTWFRDYLYIPLGGNRGTTLFKARNIFIIFLVSGLWHGANWTFVIWGGIHACLSLPMLITKKPKVKPNNNSLTLRQIPALLYTFIMVMLAWVFFRADSWSQAYRYIERIISLDSLNVNLFIGSSKMILFSLVVFFSSLVLFVMEYKAFKKVEKEVKLSALSSIAIFLMILFLGVFKNPNDFIYFQF